MRHIEYAHVFPCMYCGILDCEIRILHWHIVASKSNHLSAILQMNVIETGFLPKFFWVHISKAKYLRWRMGGKTSDEERSIRDS